MKLNRDLQHAGARFVNAKANETYFYMALIVGLIAGIGVMAYQLLASMRFVFGM